MAAKEKKEKKPIDLCVRPLLGKTVLFALPLMLSSVLQLLYSAADLIVLGRFAGEESEAAVAAVGSTGALINLVTNLFIGLSIGALAVVARFVGARDGERVSKSAHTAIVVSVIGGFVVGVAGFFLSRPMLKIMDTPDSVLSLSSLYLKIYFCGMPFNLVYNFGGSVLRACGDTRRPLLALAVAGVVNIALNIFMVAGLNMSVAGVGIATVASQATAAAGVVIALMRRKDAARLVLKKLRIHKSALIDIVKVGLPAGIQSTVFSFSNVIIQSSINGFGEIAMTGNAAAINIEGFVYVAMNAIAQSCLTVAGQNYGAAKPENIELSLVQCLILATGIGLVLGVGAYLLSRPLLRLYGCGEEAIGYGRQRLFMILIWYFLCGIMEVGVGVSRAIGKSVMPMIVSIMGVVGVRILWIYTVFRAYHTLFTLYLSYPVSWLFTAVVQFICYFVVRGKTFRRLREMRDNKEKESLQEDSAENSLENTIESMTIAENTIENTESAENNAEENAE